MDGDEDLDKGESELEEVEPEPDAVLTFRRVLRRHLPAMCWEWQ